MKKIIKKWGDGLGIYLDKEDIMILNLKEGQIVDIEDMVIENVNKGGKE